MGWLRGWWGGVVERSGVGWLEVGGVGCLRGWWSGVVERMVEWGG